MELTWYGTASLLLRAGDAAIAFDPFAGLPLTPFPAGEPLPDEDALKKVDGVFVTHGHFDHISHIPRLYAGTGTPVYCTKTPAAALTRRGLPADSIVPIAPGWRGTVGPFTVTARQGKHCKFDLPILAKTFFRQFTVPPRRIGTLWKLRLGYRENWEILFYEVEEGGTRLQVMGSMSLDPKTDYPTGAEALVLPLQGRSDQGTYALGLVERLRPRRVLLDHCDDTFPPLTQEVEVEGFIRSVEDRFSIPCQRLEKRVPLVLNGK